MSISAYTNENRKRVPPYNLDAERAILGILILDPESANVVFERLRVDHFYSENHKIIAQAIFKLYNKNTHADPITISDYLTDNNLLDRAGGPAYLASLMDTLPSKANLDYYIQIVLEKAELRRLIDTCSGIISEAYEGTDNVYELIDSAEARIFDITQNRISIDTIEPVKPVLNRLIDQLEKFSRRTDRVMGVQSGFYELDDLTNGFQDEELIIIAARPGVGKTAFALNIADYAGVELNKNIAVFSLEMSKSSIALRMMCSRARLDSHLIRQGKIPQKYWQIMIETASKLTEANIYMDDATSLTPLNIRQKCRRLKKDNGGAGLDLVIVDYLQLLYPSDNTRRYDSRANEVAAISKELKALARELKVPVIALSQLSRKPADRHSKRPMLSDLRDSGAIEQDADVVMFIHREDYYEDEDANKKKEDETEENQEKENKDNIVAEIILAKQRNGPTDTLKLLFQKNYLRFNNYDKSSHH